MDALFLLQVADLEPSGDIRSCPLVQICSLSAVTVHAINQHTSPVPNAVDMLLHAAGG